MQTLRTTGLHHITAISSNAQKTYDFYHTILGLRLVKRSVNQDDPSTYHLFFGNHLGSPGMDLTFFPFRGATAAQRGHGEARLIGLTVQAGSLPFWQQRFEALDVKHEAPQERFGRKRLIFFDNDDQALELVEVATTEIEPHFLETLAQHKAIPPARAIVSFHGIALHVADQSSLIPLLKLLGYEAVDRAQNTHLYQIPKQLNASQLEVITDIHQAPAISGAGAIHHIAFGVADETMQQAYQKALEEMGIRATEIIDRYYFKSVYFRTKVGILFELATHAPGFAVDEPVATLGQKLALPPFLEPYRKVIDQQLPPLKLT